MAKITYENKETLNEQPSIANKNKVTSGDMNEIKTVVNGIDDNTNANTTAISNLNDYSTDEINTGKEWINGKPIYRKCFQYNYAANQTTASVLASLDNPELVFPEVTIAKSTGIADFEEPFYSSSSDWCRVFYRQSNNTIEIRSSSTSTAWIIYIILEYTKTTD